jgi:hypothetical protein
MSTTKTNSSTSRLVYKIQSVRSASVRKIGDQGEEEICSPYHWAGFVLHGAWLMHPLLGVGLRGLELSSASR